MIWESWIIFSSPSRRRRQKDLLSLCVCVFHLFLYFIVHYFISMSLLSRIKTANKMWKMCGAKSTENGTGFSRERRENRQWEWMSSLCQYLCWAPAVMLTAISNNLFSSFLLVYPECGYMYTASERASALVQHGLPANVRTKAAYRSGIGDEMKWKCAFAHEPKCILHLIYFLFLLPMLVVCATN